MDRRASYYALEGRWPDAPFWARRRPVDWRAAAITLAPTDGLRRPGRAVSRGALGGAEAVVSPRAVAAALAAARELSPAHRVLGAMRENAPMEDKRLLVAVQLLIEAGALAVVA